MKQSPLVSVVNMRIAFDDFTAVSGLSFELFPNEILGVVGESGSGKSVTAMSLLGLLPEQERVLSADAMSFQNHALFPFRKEVFSALRGKEIGIIFQDPMSALNPSMRCGKQVAEMLELHTSLDSAEINERIISLFEKVKLPEPEKMVRRYPHQLSGGQQQRVMIAMAIACNPKLLIADEPTTALDPSVQKEIMHLLKALQKETKMSMLFVSHDLNLIENWANRLLVMKAGRCVESGETKQLFKKPQSAYTQGLIHAKPPTNKRPKRLPTVDDFLSNKKATANESKAQREKRHRDLYKQAPLLTIQGLQKSFVQNKAHFQALDSLDLDLYEGETLGLVGASGSGKSTLGNCLLRLTTPDNGSIIYRGQNIHQLKGRSLQQYRKEVQLVFQDPYSSLNPKQKIKNILTEPMGVHGIGMDQTERIDIAKGLLEQVGLNETHLERYPHEFSGGQRQRIGIARALSVHPKIIVCDESVSALDLSVQAQVLNLLNDLKERYGFTYVFISHDLSVVRYMSDRLVMLEKGKIEKEGETDKVFNEISL
ncbi:MAG: dipeptide ABC transporter ATP-binding protein [Flavobacteriaceae bacterium]